MPSSTRTAVSLRDCAAIDRRRGPVGATRAPCPWPLPEPELINGYGPTESTTFTCCYPVPRDCLRIAQSVPIGRPIANTKVYILDAHRHRCRSAWRASCTSAATAGPRLLEPARTDGPSASCPIRSRAILRARDVPHRRSRPLSARRQHRVPGPASTTRSSCAAFASNWAKSNRSLARNSRRCARPSCCCARTCRAIAQLVAYVVTQGEALATADLRAALRQQLPDYMIPAAFVQLPALPLTPNGKIDRKALPVPEHGSGGVGYCPPRTPVEKVIADIWAEVLNLPRVGIDDNFFDLGGHSLLAIQLLNRINRSLDIDLSLRQLFDAPTVTGMALAALDKLLIEADESVDPQ